jgi:3',5'-cyclic AMP phosphodiesterase CpdA
MNSLRIVHLSDFHYDGSPELRAALARLVDRAIDCGPDLVVVTGDLSADGRPGELDVVAAELERFGSVPRVVLPGNRDLVPSVGPPGEARPLPADSDLDYFLALEPAFGFGFDDATADPSAAIDADPETRFSSRFGRLDARHADPRVQLVAVNSTPRLRPAELERAARRLRRAPAGALRIFALHHGLLPVPGRKLRDGDLANRAGDLLALLLELKVDLVLHGHVHRAHAWLVSDGHHEMVVASAGALVNDGRRDASFNEILVGGGRLEVRRRSVATGEPSLLFQTTRPG